MTIFLPKAHIYVTENLIFGVPVQNKIKLKSKTHLKEHSPCPAFIKVSVQ